MSSLNDPEELARGTKPNTLTVIRTSDYNGWVHPDAPEDYVGSYENRSPRRDYVLTGIVVVHLAKRRRAKKLVVKFVCEARLAFPNQILEDDVIFEKALEIGDGVEGLLLDAGPQRWVLDCAVAVKLLDSRFCCNSDSSSASSYRPLSRASIEHPMAVSHTESMPC